MLDFYKEQSDVDNSDNKNRLDHPNNTQLEQSPVSFNKDHDKK